MTISEHRPLHVMIWGTYDVGKPRTRILIAALRSSGARLTEIHAPVWEGAEDKSVLGKSAAFRRGLRWLSAYPQLIWRFLRSPRPDVVIVGYLGHLDVLMLWPFAVMRRTPVVWDAFLSLYDTVVLDRQMVSRRHPAALFLKIWEWLACRASNRVVLDTDAQAQFFRETYGLRAFKVATAFVGAESDKFAILPQRKPGDKAKILFYGQFIPLHGISTIVEAARLSRGRPIEWAVIGTGQMAKHIRRMLQEEPIDNLVWTDWVPYSALIQQMESADICLGVFGDSDKAGRVIPNKVFQTLSAGRPLVTRDGPGIRELVSDDVTGIRLVPPANPEQLLQAVEQLLEQRPFPSKLHEDLRARFSDQALAKRWAEILREIVNR